MLEPGLDPRLAQEPARSSSRVGEALRRRLSATSRPIRRSSASITSPPPPRPITSPIAYGPAVVVTSSARIDPHAGAGPVSSPHPRAGSAASAARPSCSPYPHRTLTAGARCGGGSHRAGRAAPRAAGATPRAASTSGRRGPTSAIELGADLTAGGLRQVREARRVGPRSRSSVVAGARACGAR